MNDLVLFLLWLEQVSAKACDLIGYEIMNLILRAWDIGWLPYDFGLDLTDHPLLIKYYNRYGKGWSCDSYNA